MTSMGEIKVELYADKAPVSVKNFLAYVEKGHYNKVNFHRVIKDFVVQTGGMDENMTEKATMAPIENEAANGLSNLRGTLAMARTGEIHSATAQFYINLKDNVFLDHRDNSMRGFGYCVFGKVVSGMDVVDRIAAVETGNKGMHQDVPVEPVFIEYVRLIPQAAEKQ